MARARNIKPSFFFNEDLVELDYEYRLMFIGMWTLADREGRLENRPKKIKMNLFPGDNVDVAAGLRDLAEYGFIELYTANETDVIQITNFGKHQRPHGLEKDSDLPDKNGFYTVNERSKNKSGTVTGKTFLVSSLEEAEILINNGFKTTSKPTKNSKKTVIAKTEDNQVVSCDDSSLPETLGNKGLEDNRDNNSYETVSKLSDNALIPDSLIPDSLNPCVSAREQNAKDEFSVADQIRERRSTEIEDWEPPSLDTMRAELFRAGVAMQLTEDQYQIHVGDFKAHYAEQARLGKPLVSDANRKAKLRKWLQREASSQQIMQTKQAQAEASNVDWSQVGRKPAANNDDMPEVFHPSHSKPSQQAKPDPKSSVMVNGLWKPPFPGMSVTETYEYISEHQDVGELTDLAYDRLLGELQEAV